MGTATLINLRDYLYSALTPANLIWLGTQLTEYGHKQEGPLKPYTKEELMARIELSEQQFVEGKYKTIEEVFRDFDKEFETEEMMSKRPGLPSALIVCN